PALDTLARVAPTRALAESLQAGKPTADPPSIPADPDVATQTSGAVTSLIYRRPADSLHGMTATGAIGVNADWVRGKTKQWFIEEQRGAEVATIGGIVTFDPQVVEGAIRAFDWGFARQGADGGFAGTGDPFHSTSFFVAAVAHAGLFVRDAARTGRFPLAEQYLRRMTRYTPLVLRAARWMAQPAVWSRGLALNAPYTHRRYLVGTALGLTAVLTGDPTLSDRARPVLEDGLSRQQANGVNPELGGPDSSYQMTGVVFAQYWVSYLPDHPLTARIRTMIDRALTWEATRTLPSGEVTARGNTRTAGQEKARDGVVKGVAYSRVIRGFATWAALTGDPRWAELAWRTGRYYYGTPALAARPLLP
ncbi:MAG: hypothetical protein ACRDG4_09930, partial [Chloroflexota bacterium]